MYLRHLICTEERKKKRKREGRESESEGEKVDYPLAEMSQWRAVACGDKFPFMESFQTRTEPRAVVPRLPVGFVFSQS